MMLEVIAPVSLREALSLKDGDVVTVKVFLSSANSGSSLGSYPRA